MKPSTKNYNLLHMLVAEAMKEDSSTNDVECICYSDEVEKFHMQKNHKQYWTLFWQYAIKRYRPIINKFINSGAVNWYNHAVTYFSRYIDVTKIKDTWYVEYLEDGETIKAWTVRSEFKHNLHYEDLDFIKRLVKDYETNYPWWQGI